MKVLVLIWLFLITIQLGASHNNPSKEVVAVRYDRDRIRSRYNQSIEALHIRINDLYEALQKSKEHQQVVDEELKKYEA